MASKHTSATIAWIPRSRCALTRRERAARSGRFKPIHIRSLDEAFNRIVSLSRVTRKRSEPMPTVGRLMKFYLSASGEIAYPPGIVGESDHKLESLIYGMFGIGEAREKDGAIVSVG